MTKASTPPWVCQNVSHISISAIKEMAMLSARTEGAVSLAWGLPDFRTPAYIREGAMDRLQHDPDVGKYSLPDGLPELRRLVVNQHGRNTGVAADPEENVMITSGNMQGLHTLFHVVTDPGDEIILTDPGFASHFQQIRLCGGKPVCWPLREEKGWSLDPKSLPGLISAKTKAIVLVSPSNPTGKIFSREGLLCVGEIAKERDLLILIDDPYPYYIYENRDRYFNLASQKELFDRLVYCFTFSKTFAMSGWRLGYMILPASLKREALKVHDATMICTPRISQLAGIAALKGGASHLAEFERILGARRLVICERLDRLAHVFEYVKPEGAYYVFPRILWPHKDSVEFSKTLLREAKVTVTPGSAFGPAGEHHVRMAFCVSEDTINEAFDRMETYFGRR